MGKSRKMTAREVKKMLETERMSLADLGHAMSAWADDEARCYNCSGWVRNEGVVFMESSRLRGQCVWEDASPCPKCGIPSHGGGVC
jgi:hypothetical protein